jgi:hypothetical protein
MISCYKQLRLLIILFIPISSLFANQASIKNPNPNLINDREIGFSITPIFSMDTENPQITVISPNGGELWLMNTQKDIVWTASDSNFNNDPINIMLSIDNGQTYNSVIEAIPNNGSYLWLIPDLIGPQSLIKIWAIDNFGNMGFDVSDIVFNLPGSTVSVTPVFSLDTIDPLIELLSPNGGENWDVGEIHSIDWTASDNNLSSSPISIDFRVGTSWIPLENSYSNLGTYQWIIPDLLTPQAYVRITISDIFGNSASDFSENSFIIGSAIPAIVQNVNAVRVNLNDIQISWDPVTQTVHGYPLQPSGYFVLANESDDPWNMGAYDVIGITDTTTVFLHENALLAGAHIFYRIIAVKDDKTNKSVFLKNLNKGFYNIHDVKWFDFKRNITK